MGEGVDTGGDQYSREGRSETAGQVGREEEGGGGGG